MGRDQTETLSKERYPETGGNTQSQTSQRDQIETQKLGKTETEGVRQISKRETRGRHRSSNRETKRWKKETKSERQGKESDSGTLRKGCQEAETQEQVSSLGTKALAANTDDLSSTLGTPQALVQRDRERGGGASFAVWRSSRQPLYSS